MLIWILLLLPILVLMPAGCIRNQNAKPTSTRRPLIVAHRGASGDAPENTMAAFAMGFDRNADAVEGDFRLTRDGIIVAMHDNNDSPTMTVRGSVRRCRLPSPKPAPRRRPLFVGVRPSP